MIYLKVVARLYPLEPLHSFIRNGNELENSVLNLGEYGQILVNLKIKHISEENNRKQCDATSFRVSCMFYYESEEKREDRKNNCQIDN